MATINTTQFARYCKIFPELTPTQSMTGIMFSMGLPIQTIADSRNVSDESVRKTLQETQKRLELSNLSGVKGVVQVRLTMAMMGVYVDKL